MPEFIRLNDEEFETPLIDFSSTTGRNNLMFECKYAGKIPRIMNLSV